MREATGKREEPETEAPTTREKKEKRYTVDDIDFNIPVHKTPTYSKILQFVHEMYEHQTDISITIIDDRFTIMGSMKSKEDVKESKE